MRRILKLSFYLVVMGAVALIGYAYLADLTPTQVRVSDPVKLNVE